jgi:hypothetical protein
MDCIGLMVAMEGVFLGSRTSRVIRFLRRGVSSVFPTGSAVLVRESLTLRFVPLQLTTRGYHPDVA